MSANSGKIPTPGSSTMDLPADGDSGNVKWWETSEGHRFAGEVLQLKIRREIMAFIGSGIKTKKEIKAAFGLNEQMAEIHLALLEKADMIKLTDDGYISTAIGIAYLKNFETAAKD